MEKRKSLDHDLTQGSPAKLIIAFAVPMIMGNLFQQLYNFVDTMIVGHFLGVDALAGVGATGSINFLIIGFCIGMCAGFSVPVAQMYGAKDYVALRKFVANSLYLAVGFSAVITVIVSIFCYKILVLMSTPADVIEYSYTYILTIILGIPVTFLYNVLAGIIRSIGDSRTPLIILVISTFINVGLDVLFIAVLGWGVFGAAFATVLSQLASGIMCIVVIVKKFEILHVSGQEWKLDSFCVKKLIQMGLPMGLQYSITAIGSVILQASVNGLGAISVAAVTAASKVNMLFICIVDALGASMATYGGQNIGAGRVDRIRKGTFAAVIIGIVYSLIAFVVVIFIRRPLVGLFIDKPMPEMLEQADLHIIVTMASLSLVVFVNVLRFLIQGVGYSTFAILAGVLEMIARTIAGLFFIPKLGFMGACLATPFAWVLADMFLIPAFFYVVGKLDKIVINQKNSV